MEREPMLPERDMSVTVILTYLSLSMVKSVPGEIERKTEKKRQRQVESEQGREISLCKLPLYRILLTALSDYPLQGGRSINIE